MVQRNAEFSVVVIFLVYHSYSMTIFTLIQANMWVTSVRRQEIFCANIFIKFLEWELLFDNETCVRQIHCRRLSLTEKLPPKD